MSDRIRQNRHSAAGALVLLLGLIGPGSQDAAAQAPIPELVPPGWTMRQSTTSIYFTRPDLPNVQVGLVNDIRPGPTQEQKFEAAKQFFSERANCPALASAETQKSFGGFSAWDDAKEPRCHLVGLGHWREGGLQMAIVVNETPTAGPKPGDDVFDAIVQDVVQYAMYRYEIGDREIDRGIGISAEAHAKTIDGDHKPLSILSFVDEAAVYSDAMTAIEIMNHEPGAPFPRRDETFQPVLLFEDSADDRRFGSICTDWDPGFFSPGAILRYHAKNECFRFDWRWKDGVEGGELEVDPIPGDWMPITDYLKAERQADFAAGEPYRRIRRGATLDLQIGYWEPTLRQVAAGELPVAALRSNDVILTSEGRIMLGHLETATLPELDPAVATYRPVQGTYFFDGHVVTIKLDDGHVVRGFAGWIPGADESELGEGSTLMINGVHYLGR